MSYDDGSSNDDIDGCDDDTKRLVVKEYCGLITLSVYVVPRGAARLVRMKAVQAGLLLENRAPSQLSLYRDVLVAINVLIICSLVTEKGKWLKSMAQSYWASSFKCLTLYI